jgi:hypothetical protein
MIEQINPFLYGRPIQRKDELVDREQELGDVVAAARSGQALMVYGPRRYGKTSLARVAEEQLLRDWSIGSVYVDLWGITSIADIVNVLGRAFADASGADRVKRFLWDVLRSLGFTVSLGGVSVSRNTTPKSTTDRAALRDLLDVPQRLAARSEAGRLLMILDEFGEIFHVPEQPDALMRNAFQAAPDVSFVFMGSKRSLMDALFTDRQRPFYNFGRRMELGRLPSDALGSFIEQRFDTAGGQITSSAVDVLLTLADGHPYRVQQLAYHTFALAPRRAADEETVQAAKDAALDETAAEFRAIVDGMSPNRRALFVAICREPTTELHSRPYMQRHGIRGSGSLDSALRSLVDSGDVECVDGRPPTPTDPLFAMWARERMNGAVP